MPKVLTYLSAALATGLLLPAGALAQSGEKADPAGGAAIGEVILATAMAGVVTAIALVIVIGHRTGRVKFVGRAAAYAERMTGVPGWASLPNVFVGGAQPGTPVSRSAYAAARPTSFTRPERWPITTRSAIAETTPAIAVARITSPIAAPPAGSAFSPACAKAPAGATSTAVRAVQRARA